MNVLCFSNTQIWKRFADGDPKSLPIRLISIALIGAILLAVSPRAQAAGVEVSHKGVIIGTDGKPAAGVQVFMATPSRNVKIQNGRALEYFLREGVHEVSAADGSFSFPPQTDAFLLLAIHDNGYAKVTDTEFKTNSQIRLQAWATVQGVVKTGTKPGARQTLYFGYADRSGQNTKKPQVFAYHGVEADESGRFRFERVMDGEVSVAKTVKISDRKTGYSFGTNVVVEPGQTLEVTLGGNGRPVVGRIDFPSDLKKGSWTSGEANVRANVKMPKSVIPPEFRKMTAEEKTAWFEKWRYTLRDEAILAEQRRVNEQKKYFAARVEADGSFRIDDVPEGSYVLNITLTDLPMGQRYGPDEEIATATHEFTMPSIPGGVSDVPLELATLPVTRINRLKIGDIAP